jgi:protein TonB
VTHPPTPPPPETPPPAKSAEAEVPPVRPGDLVENPDEPPGILQQVSPDFPALARAQRLSDRVVVRVLVDERGRVVDTQVLQYKHAILRDAALEAIRKYTFRPARHQGVPVKSWYTVIVTFQP